MRRRAARHRLGPRPGPGARTRGTHPAGRRVSIAPALAGSPEIAILDEPTTGLDPQARRDTWRLIEDVRDRGVTVVLVTHFMEEAERRCDRIAVIDTGRVAAVDTPAGAREAGVLDERARMAREIHGTLAEGFTGIIAQLEAARQNPGQWQRFTGQAQALARENLDEARRSVQALRPEYLEDAHLPEAIAGTSERWSRTSGVAIGVEATGEPRPMLADVEVALFGVAQEALNNIAARQGLPRRADPVVHGRRGTPRRPRRRRGLRARGDDGPGVRPGLDASVAGGLEVESSPGEGTAVNASVPTLPAGGGA